MLYCLCFDYINVKFLLLYYSLRYYERGIASSPDKPHVAPLSRALPL